MTDAQDGGVTTTRNDAQHRYELYLGDELAVIAVYRDVPGHIDFIHTVTEPGHEGHGLAATLVRYALDDVVASGQRIIPHCPYVARFIEKNLAVYGPYTDAAEDF